jgi:hypothetical protein
MSRKNFQVATDKGQTPTQNTKHIFATVNAKKDKTPTGKVKTLKDKDALKKQREDDYINFRVNALKRRAKRMGLTEEQTKVKVEELLKQMKEPNNYMILILFNPDNTAMLNEMLKNEGLAYTMQGRGYMYIEGEQDVLDIVRGFDIPGAKIHPYVKRKPPILPVQEPPKSTKKPKIKAEKKAAAKAAKKACKDANNIKKRVGKEYMKFRKRCNIAALPKAEKARLKAERKASSKVVHMKAKKASVSPKKASMTKKAA